MLIDYNVNVELINMHSFKKVKLELGKVCVSLKEDSPIALFFFVARSWYLWLFSFVYDQILSNITSHTFLK